MAAPLHDAGTVRPPPASRNRERWALVLAGGDGVRLRPLTRLIAGDERPKQFCSVLGNETLLDQTLARAALAVDPRQTLVLLTRAHEPFYASLVAGLPPGASVVQPDNRGTAPAILYGLQRIAAVAPAARVVILPSDHYVSDDAAFMRYVGAAFAAVGVRPDLVVLLGIHPEGPETEYGWVEPADRVLGPVRRVRRFWEKPAPALARSLMLRGCLWNSFVIVAGVAALLALSRQAVPALADGFAAVARRPHAGAEARAAARLYRRLTPVSFSDAVLACGARNLAVLRVTGVTWSDWGRPERVLSTLARLGRAPRWAEAPTGRLA